METEKGSTKIEPKKVTRRWLLKRMTAAGVLLAIGGGLRESTARKKESLESLPPNIIMIDFAPERKTEGIEQETFPNNQAIMKKILGKEYRASYQLMLEFGLRALDLKTLEKEVFSKYPRLALVYGFMKTYARHGEGVAFAMKSTLAKSGFGSEPHIVPLQEMLGGYEFTQDELGNHGLFGEVDPEKIIKVLTHYPNKQIINFSFQIGRMGFIYREKSKDVKPGSSSKFPTVVTIKDKEGKTRKSILTNGKSVAVTEEELERIYKKIEKEISIVVEHEPFFDIEDAYTSQAAKENLPKLFKICAAFPDKLFVVAAGNHGDYFIDERITLKDQWPQNLLMTAEWTAIGPAGRVEGADIYVDNKELGLSPGSSFSAPAISAIALVLEKQGLEPAEIRAKIEGFCDTETYESWEPKSHTHAPREAHVFKLDRFKQYLAGLSPS